MKLQAEGTAVHGFPGGKIPGLIQKSSLNMKSVAADDMSDLPGNRSRRAQEDMERTLAFNSRKMGSNERCLS